MSGILERLNLQPGREGIALSLPHGDNMNNETDKQKDNDEKRHQRCGRCAHIHGPSGMNSLWWCKIWPTRVFLHSHCSNWEPGGRES